MKRKTPSEYRSHEWADFKDIMRRLAELGSTPHAVRIEQLLDLLSNIHERNGRAGRFGAIQSALSRYRWRQIIAPTAQGLVLVPRPPIAGLSQKSLVEQEVVSDLLRLVTTQDGAARIRRCEIAHCHKWFFALGRKDQRWCSGTCRQYDYDNSVVRKAKRRESVSKAMRDLRKREKDTDIRLKQSVGFTTKKSTAHAAK